MEFILNTNHRNLTDRQLIDDVILTAKMLNKDTLTADEYSKNGQYNCSTLIRRFGSWKQVLEQSSLKTDGHNFKCAFSKDEVVADLLNVANKLKKDSLTKQEYDNYGNYSSSTLAKKYGGWNEVLKLAGLQLNVRRNITDEEMFCEIKRIWMILGRQPTSNDMKKGISTISLQSYSRRFGGWRNALDAFINYNHADSTLHKAVNESDTLSVKKDRHNSITYKHRTNRDISNKLRFAVLKRDHYKCCICGASPAKDPSVELHIDHIIPWSKGGETTLDNLQTLCSKCNLGKSDSLQ